MTIKTTRTRLWYALWGVVCCGVIGFGSSVAQAAQAVSIAPTTPYHDDGQHSYQVAAGAKSFFKIFGKFGDGDDDDSEDEKVKKFDAAIERDPENANNYYERAMFWKGRGRWARAIDDFNTALELRENWADAHYHRSVALMESGYQEEGKEARDKAYDLGYNSKKKGSKKKNKKKKKDKEQSETIESSREQ